METYREYQAFRAQQSENQENLVLARAELKKRERYMDLLESDPEILEHVARERLKYSKPNELIFHFKSK